MIVVIAFSHPEADIASGWAAITKQDGILIMQRHSDNALVAVRVLVAIEIGDDLFFQLVLIGRINNTLWFSALEVDKDVIALRSDGPCLAPIDDLSALCSPVLPAGQH